VWNAGIGSLMSREFYALCRARLRPDGVLCSWIQGYALSPDALRSVLAAVRSSFPRAQLWRGAWGDFLIVAGGDHLAVDAGRLLAMGSAPEIAAVLHQADAPDLASLLSLNLLAGEALDRWVGSFPPNTDDRPYLEFAAPKLLYADPMPELFGALHAAAAGAELVMTDAPEGLPARIPRWRRARAAESEARLALRDGEGDAALRLLEEAHALLPTAPSIRRTLAGALNQRGSALARRGQAAAAAESFARGIEVDPAVAASYTNLARMYLDGGGVETALELTAEGLRALPDSPELHAMRAQALLRAQSHPEARAEAQRALELDPRLLAGFEALADALERLGETARAESVLAAGAAVHPDAESLRARIRRVTGAGKPPRTE
jgi:spermidine synthase